MLSTEEKAQFVERGYVIKQIDLNQDVIDRAVDLTWSHVESHFERDNPDSWVGEIADSCRIAPISKRRGRLKFRECVRDTDWLVDMVYGDQQIKGWVESLLGPKGGPRNKIRGLYPIFPSPTSSYRVEGGMDAHPFQICCIIYLNDTDENCGEFSLWEGSHRIMKDCFPGKASWKMLSNMADLRERAQEECQHVTFPGPAGTVILWHHRCLHTPITNRSRHVRHALVADFLQSDWEQKRDEPHEADMWADWAVGEELLKEPARRGLYAAE